MIAAPSLLALVFLAAQGSVGTTFPQEFQGRWDLSREACANEESGTGLTVTPTEIVGYEDTSTLKALHVLEGGSLHAELELESAEANGPVQRVMWRSSDGGEWLFIEGDSAPRAIRYERCAAATE